MRVIVNEWQAAAWNGYEGRHWADHQTRYDAVNSGFNDLLLAAVRPGDRVLDVGCGTGQLTRLAAGRAGADGSALGIDLSAPMLARARASAASERVANVEFVQADAQVHPFEPATVDLALSRFGVMFFADPRAAFANVGRALRPGGRLAFVCMDDVRGGDLGAVLAALAPLLPPSTDGTGVAEPLSLADPAVVRSVLTEAGFTDVDCVPAEAPQDWGRDAADAAAFLVGWGPIRHQLELAGRADPAGVAAAGEALAAVLRRHEQPDAVRLRGTAWLVTAHRHG